MARPMIGTPEEAAERRRRKTAERVRRLRERRRAVVVAQPEPTPPLPAVEAAPPPTPHRKGGIGADRLRSFVERIERLEEELGELGGLRRRNPTLADAYARERSILQKEIKEVYAEAKGTGFDATVLQEVIRLRKMDREQQAVLNLYLEVLEP